MKRRVGSTFEFRGKKLKVENRDYNYNGHICEGCFFKGKVNPSCCSDYVYNILGDCAWVNKNGKKTQIIFKEV